MDSPTLPTFNFRIHRIYDAAAEALGINDAFESKQGFLKMSDTGLRPPVGFPRREVLRSTTPSYERFWGNADDLVGYRIFGKTGVSQNHEYRGYPKNI